MMFINNITQKTRIDIPYTADDIFFSSDEHFGHINILKYTYRGHDSIAEMERDYVYRHNAVVPARNSVWINMGDFVFTKRGKDAVNSKVLVKRLVSEMNGEIKILFPGNHDGMNSKEYLECGFTHVVGWKDIAYMSVDGLQIRMSHEPPVLNKKYQERVEKERARRRLTGDIQTEKNPMYLLDRTKVNESSPDWNDMESVDTPYICGHIHQLFRLYARGPVVNVGVDVWAYPVSLATILSLLCM